MQKLKQQLGRVFDDDLKTWQWKNIADWTIIGLIIVSTVEVFLSTFDNISSRYGRWLTAIDLFTTVVFTIEVTLRIWCADLIDPKYKGFWGRVRYCLSFYGFIDLVSTYSFYVASAFPCAVCGLEGAEGVSPARTSCAVVRAALFSSRTSPAPASRSIHACRRSFAALD